MHTLTPQRCSPKMVTMRPKMMQIWDAHQWMLDILGFLTIR